MCYRNGARWLHGRQRLSAATRQAWAYTTVPGGLGVLLLPGNVGRIVHALGKVEEVDVSAVSSSIDAHPWFSRDAESALMK